MNIHLSVNLPYLYFVLISGENTDYFSTFVLMLASTHEPAQMTGLGFLNFQTWGINCLKFGKYGLQNLYRKETVKA